MTAGRFAPTNDRSALATHRFALSDLPSVPWRNGAGRTRELACWPPGTGAEDFEWRCSVASVEADGPFSAYPGVDRQILSMDGGGVHLHGPGIDHRLEQPLQPFAFAGELALRGTPLDGPSTDFNLMTRRGRWLGELQVHDRAVRLRGAPHGLLLALAGCWRIGLGAPLAAGQGLWWADAPAPAEVAPDAEGARLIAVRLCRA